MRYFTYGERHRQHLAAVGALRLRQPVEEEERHLRQPAAAVVRQTRPGVVLNISLASVFIPLKLAILREE